MPEQALPISIEGFVAGRAPFYGCVLVRWPQPELHCGAMAFADVNGVRLWHEDSGIDGPPVLLVHGAAGSSENWFQQLPALEAAGYRWIRYDLRGAGKSEAPDGAEGEGSVVADLEALVAHLGLASFVLVTQAAGGFGGFEYALSNPGKLTALVVANSIGGITDRDYVEFRRLLMGPDSDAWPREERELGRSFRAANPEGVAHFMEMEHRGRSDFSRRQKARTALTLAMLEKLNMPVLLIASDEDVLSPPPLMRLLAERISDCSFIEIAGAGHCSYYEKPDEWNRIVTGFLDSHR
jgi:pimeloyl-ACP methyl ester carboxylesterase